MKAHIPPQPLLVLKVLQASCFFLLQANHNTGIISWLSTHIQFSSHLPCYATVQLQLSKTTVCYMAEISLLQ